MQLSYGAPFFNVEIKTLNYLTETFEVYISPFTSFS